MSSGLGTLCLLLIFVSIEETSAIAQSQTTPFGAPSTVIQPVLSEYQKEALTAIKDMTSNLLFLAIGVFALVGGYLSKDAPIFKGRKVLMWSFFCFGFSLAGGLVLYMRLIDQLQAQSFDPNDGLLRWSSIIQILSIVVGSLLFFLFLRSNIKDA